MSIEAVQWPATERVAAIHGAIRDVVRNGRGNDDRWIVVAHRFALEGGRTRKLEEIARALDVTRERVRQQEERALDLLRASMRDEQNQDGSDPDGLSLRSLVRPFLDLVERRGSAIRQDLLYPDAAVALGVSQGDQREETSSCPTAVRVIVDLLLTSLGYERKSLHHADLSPLWTKMPKETAEALIQRIEALHRHLTKQAVLPYAPLDLLMDVNDCLPKSNRILREELDLLVRLTSSLERLADGKIQARFEYLEGRANQVERLLTEHGKPMSLRDLAREINHRVVPLGHKKVATANLSNQLSGNGRIVPIARSGDWGLGSWPDITTAPIVHLMEECLIVRNAPATPNEIFTYVRDRRPAERGSIDIYLHDRPEFMPVGHDTWGLTAWGSDACQKTWDAEDVAELVASLLRERRVRELPYPVVKDALVEASGLTPRQAQGKLNQNHLLKVRAGQTWGVRLVSLVPAEEIAPRPPRARKQLTVQEQVGRLVRAILEQAPNHELPLDQLLARVRSQVVRPKQTLYAYIGRLDFIEKVQDVSTRRTVCRLVSTTPHAQATLSHSTAEARLV